MTDHTPEPWRTGGLGIVAEGIPYRIASANDSPTVGDAHANAARIVACVNACAGIPTEQLGDVKALVEALDLTLSTAAHFERQASRNSGGRRGSPVFEKARAALAPFRKD